MTSETSISFRSPPKRHQVVRTGIRQAVSDPVLVRREGARPERLDGFWIISADSLGELRGKSEGFFHRPSLGDSVS